MQPLLPCPIVLVTYSDIVYDPDTTSQSNSNKLKQIKSKLSGITIKVLS